LSVRVKVCGVTRLEDALAAVDLGVDAIGFNFVEGSPRRVAPELARDIAGSLPPFVARIGVFADERPPVMEATARMAGLHCLQLHGEEAPELCSTLAMPWYKAHRVAPGFRPEDVTRYASSTFLLDAHVPGRRGGTGRSFDWSVAARAGAYGRVILAGGLTPENVGRAIRTARPYAVDVSSGVESAPGLKDIGRLRSFVRSARRAAKEAA
jgi:phosphoribosylanthranilate isomerase